MVRILVYVWGSLFFRGELLVSASVAIWLKRRNRSLHCSCTASNFRPGQTRRPRPQRRQLGQAHFVVLGGPGSGDVCRVVFAPMSAKNWAPFGAFLRVVNLLACMGSRVETILFKTKKKAFLFLHGSKAENCSTQNASAGAQKATGCLELALVVPHLGSPRDMLPLCAEEASPGQKEGNQERRPRKAGNTHVVDVNVQQCSS